MANLALVLLLAGLLAGCASTDDTGRFVGTVVGAGIKAGLGGDDRDRDRVVVIHERRGWGPPPRYYGYYPYRRGW